MAIKRSPITKRLTEKEQVITGRRTSLNKESMNNGNDKHETASNNNVFAETLAKAKQKKRNAKTIKVAQKKVQPKVDKGTYLAITTDAQLEKNVQSTFGVNDRIKITFEVFVTESASNSTTLVNVLDIQ